MNRFNDWKSPEFDEDGYAYERLEKWDILVGKYYTRGKKYGWRCDYNENLKLGTNTDIGCFSYLQAQEKIEISDDVQVGGGVMIYSVNTIDNTKGKVIIGENCKIGANSVILPNCIIGKNSMIGANSLLKSDTIIPKNEIWSGTPADKIGYIKNDKRIYL